MAIADIRHAGPAPVAPAEAALARPENRPDLVILLRQAAELTAPGARPDIDRLRTILKQAEARALQSQKITAHLRRQLQLASTDGKQIRRELYRKRADVTRLEREVADRVQAGELRESALRSELFDARCETQAIQDSTAHDRRIWVGLSLSIAVAAILCVAASYWRNSHPADQTEAAFTQSLPAVNPNSGELRPPPVAMTRDINNAIARLDEAFGRLQKDTPEAVLRRVHSENEARGVQVCAFEWNSGQPSLLFSGASDRDLNDAITDCADAVIKAAQ